MPIEITDPADERVRDYFTLTDGFVGAHYGRRLSPVLLRGLIVTIGVLAIAKIMV